MHDFFNGRWYDYTGLSPDDSLGLGWKNPFHPDDMAETTKRWTHSLKTGDPYVTEYRCLSKEGEWRWHLGRALPLRNLETGKIEKWFGKLQRYFHVLTTGGRVNVSYLPARWFGPLWHILTSRNRNLYRRP